MVVASSDALNRLFSLAADEKKIETRRDAPIVTTLPIGTRGRRPWRSGRRAPSPGLLEARGTRVSSCVIIKTAGDRTAGAAAHRDGHQAPVRQGNRGRAAARRRWNYAVHSAKDLPGRAARATGRRGGAAARRSARRARPAGRPRAPRPGRPPSTHLDEGPSSARAACAVSPSWRLDPAGELRAHPRQRRYAAAQAGRRRVQRAGPGGRRHAPPRIRPPHLGPGNSVRRVRSGPRTGDRRHEIRVDDQATGAPSAR